MGIPLADGADRAAVSRRQAVRLGLAGVALALRPRLSTASAPLAGGRTAILEPPKSLIYLQGSPLSGTPKDVVPSIFSVDPDSGVWTQVLDVLDLDRNVRVSPDGARIAYGEYEIVKREAGNPDRPRDFVRPIATWVSGLAKGAEPAKVSDVGGRPLWMPDGQRLILFSRPSPDAWETWSIAVDGSNAKKLGIPATDAVNDVTSDAQWALTVTRRHVADEGGNHIYLMRLDGTDQRRLTKTGNNVSPRLSPDGSKIAFCHWDTDTEQTSIVVMDRDGGHPRVVYEERDLITPSLLCWSPDGRRIAAVMHGWELDRNGRKTIRNWDLARPRLCVFEIGKKDYWWIEAPVLLELGPPGWR
jgi:Tol biopolymer transport system component